MTQSSNILFIVCIPPNYLSNWSVGKWHCMRIKNAELVTLSIIVDEFLWRGIPLCWRNTILDTIWARVVQAIHDSIAIKFHLETKIIPPKNPVIIFSLLSKDLILLEPFSMYRRKVCMVDFQSMKILSRIWVRTVFRQWETNWQLPSLNINKGISNRVVFKWGFYAVRLLSQFL